jgi:hypothetical protein
MNQFTKYKYNLKAKFDEMPRTRQLICKAKIYETLDITNNVLSIWSNIILGEPAKVDAMHLSMIADIINCEISELINKPKHIKR